VYVDTNAAPGYAAAMDWPYSRDIMRRYRLRVILLLGRAAGISGKPGR
jgi:hypothetical protein